MMSKFQILILPLYLTAGLTGILYNIKSVLLHRICQIILLIHTQYMCVVYIPVIFVTLV